MKKIVLLSAAMSLALSSLTFAADNPPPPPGKAAAGQQHNGHNKNLQQHSAKRPAQSAQHNGKPSPKGKSPAHGNQQPPKDGQQNGKQVEVMVCSCPPPVPVELKTLASLPYSAPDAHRPPV